MHRSLSGLPRVRASFPGSPVKHTHRSCNWTALLFAAGALLLICSARIAGRICRDELKDSSSSSASTQHGQGATPPTAAAAAVSAQAAHGKHGWSSDAAMGMQSLQQGIDFAASDVSRMLHERPQQQQPGTGGTFMQPGLVSPEDALNSRPELHGRVRKAGMLDPKCWLHDHADQRLDSFIGWRLNRTRAPARRTAYTCAAADHPPLPFPGCHVFVNHKYKYIYIRNPKSASTSIVNVLGECDNVRTAGYNSSSCMALHFYWPESALELDALQHMWANYFVFGFVRNPWRRAYSMHKYMHSSGCMNDLMLKNKTCRVPWSRFCADPWAATEELHNSGCIKRTKSYLYFHMTDQSHCMRTAAGDWAVDFIGRVDEPDEDWAEVIKALNARRDPDVPELPVGALGQTNVQKGADRDPYSGENAQCFNSVSRWYACDIERFGFAAAASGKAPQAT